jgi:ABC-type glycerol-3-phosphate transport system permease component
VQILTRFVLPNTFPAWSSLIVFVAMGSWNNLLAPMLYLYDEAKYPIPCALFAFQGAHKTDYELLSAAMIISILSIVAVYMLFQSRFQTNLLAGLIKG